MEQLLNKFKTFGVSSLVILLALILTFGFSAQVYGQASVPGNLQNSQAAGFIYGNKDTGNGQVNQGAIAGIGGCVGGVVAGVVAAFIGTYTNPDTYTMVSTTGVDPNAHSGSSTGIPSWDSIAYCVINIIITYIADSTIAWINSGFNGNPAFVDNPQKFFGDLANIEAAGFLQEVAYNTTGLNICQPFRVNISTGIRGQTGTPGSAQGRFQCTLGQIGQNAQNFQVYTSVGGQNSGSLANFQNMTQNPQNNPYGASLMAQNELGNRIALQKNTANIDMSMGSGFLSFKKCDPDQTVTDQNGNQTVTKGPCKTTTPGHVISDTLDSRLHMGTDRLVLADKFDQVVSALVQALIKTALNKVLNNN